MIYKLEKKGTRQLVWLPIELFNITEMVRKKWGMSRSGFYRYAVTQLLQDLSVLSTKAKEGMIMRNSTPSQSETKDHKATPKKSMLKTLLEIDGENNYE